MTPVYITIADFIIKITVQNDVRLFYKKSLLQSIRRKLALFISDGKGRRADAQIRFVKQKPWDIWEISRPEKKGVTRYFRFFFEKRGNSYLINYNTGIFQFLLLLKKIIEELLHKHENGFFLHTSACIYKNKVILFMGTSGAGKSTIVKMFKSAGGIPLTDDSAVVIYKKNKFHLCQTPFIETNYIIRKSREIYPVDFVFFLKKSGSFRVLENDDKLLIFRRLVKQIFTRRNLTKRQAQLLLRFVSLHRFGTLCFTKNKKDLEKFTESYFPLD